MLASRLVYSCRETMAWISTVYVLCLVLLPSEAAHLEGFRPETRFERPGFAGSWGQQRAQYPQPRPRQYPQPISPQRLQRFQQMGNTRRNMVNRIPNSFVANQRDVGLRSQVQSRGAPNIQQRLPTRWGPGSARGTQQQNFNRRQEARFDDANSLRNSQNINPVENRGWIRGNADINRNSRTNAAQSAPMVRPRTLVNNPDTDTGLRVNPRESNNDQPRIVRTNAERVTTLTANPPINDKPRVDTIPKPAAVPRSPLVLSRVGDVSSVLQRQISQPSPLAEVIDNSNENDVQSAEVIQPPHMRSEVLAVRNPSTVTTNQAIKTIPNDQLKSSVNISAIRSMVDMKRRKKGPLLVLVRQKDGTFKNTIIKLKGEGAFVSPNGDSVNSEVALAVPYSRPAPKPEVLLPVSGGQVDPPKTNPPVLTPDPGSQSRPSVFQDAPSVTVPQLSNPSPVMPYSPPPPDTPLVPYAPKISSSNFEEVQKPVPYAPVSAVVPNTVSSQDAPQEIRRNNVISPIQTLQNVEASQTGSASVVANQVPNVNVQTNAPFVSPIVNDPQQVPVTGNAAGVQAITDIINRLRTGTSNPMQPFIQQQVNSQQQNMNPLQGGVNSMGMNTLGLNGMGLGMNGIGTGMNGMGIGMNGMSTGMNGMGIGLNGMGIGMNGMGTGMNGMRMGMNGMGMGMNGLGIGAMASNWDGSSANVPLHFQRMGITHGSQLSPAMQEMLFGDSIDPPDPTAALTTTPAPTTTSLPSTTPPTTTSTTTAPSTTEHVPITNPPTTSTTTVISTKGTTLSTTPRLNVAAFNDGTGTPAPIDVAESLARKLVDLMKNGNPAANNILKSLNIDIPYSINDKAPVTPNKVKDIKPVNVPMVPIKQEHKVTAINETKPIDRMLSGVPKLADDATHDSSGNIDVQLSSFLSSNDLGGVKIERIKTKESPMPVETINMPTSGNDATPKAMRGTEKIKSRVPIVPVKLGSSSEMAVEQSVPLEQPVIQQPNDISPVAVMGDGPVDIDNPVIPVSSQAKPASVHSEPLIIDNSGEATVGAIDTVPITKPTKEPVLVDKQHTIDSITYQTPIPPPTSDQPIAVLDNVLKTLASSSVGNAGPSMDELIKLLTAMVKPSFPVTNFANPTTTTVSPATTTTTTSTATTTIPTTTPTTTEASTKPATIASPVCTPAHPDFQCRGKDFFATLQIMGRWCVETCRTKGCVHSVCECNCWGNVQPSPDPVFDRPGTWQQNWGRHRPTPRPTTTTTEEPPEIEEEDMISTTAAYEDSTYGFYSDSMQTTPRTVVGDDNLPSTPRPPPSWRGTVWELPPAPVKPTQQSSEEEQTEKPVERSTGWFRAGGWNQGPATPPSRWIAPRRSNWNNHNNGGWAEPPPGSDPWRMNMFGFRPSVDSVFRLRDKWRQSKYADQSASGEEKEA